jgi:penicillin amidase
MKQMIASQITKVNSFGGIILKHNKRKTEEKSCPNPLRGSCGLWKKQLGNSVSEWTWNKVHIVEYKHPLGKVAALRKICWPICSFGPNEINNQMFDYANEGNTALRRSFN